jgi:hypothetical protein
MNHNILKDIHNYEISPSNIMTTYLYANFDYIDTFLDIPANTVFYRGVPEGVEIIRNYPMYLAPEHIAKMYGKCIALYNNKSLKLVDIRKLINILPMIINSQEYDVSTDINILNSIQYLMMGLGITTYENQIRMFANMTTRTLENPSFDQSLREQVLAKLKKMFDYRPKSNPLEAPRGVRIGETTINGKIILIMKELFKNYCDGYIAPQLPSPYHDEGFVHEEIVLFNPKNFIEIYNGNVSDKPITDILPNNKINLKFDKISKTIYTGGAYPIDPNLYFMKSNSKEIKQSIKEAKVFSKFLTSNLKKKKESNPKNVTTISPIKKLYII